MMMMMIMLIKIQIKIISQLTGNKHRNTTRALHLVCQSEVWRSCIRLRLKCDGTRAETGFHLLAKQTSPFKLAGESFQWTTSSRGVRISCSNAGYTKFRGSVKDTGYPLHLPVSPSFPLPCFTVCHHISTGIYSLVYVSYFCFLHADIMIYRGTFGNSCTTSCMIFTSQRIYVSKNHGHKVSGRIQTCIG